MTKRRFLGIIGAMITVILVVIGVDVFLIINNTSEDNNEVLRLDIYLDGVDLQGIKEGSKDAKYENNKMNFSSGDWKSEELKIIISGRGNSTWEQKKKPYRIILDKKIDLFGLGKSKQWILLANHFDDTHLRNEAAFMMWNMLDNEIKMQEEPVELYVNDEYEGMYYLTRKIQIAKNMINLRDLNGVIVELDNINTNKEECYLTIEQNCLIAKDLVLDINQNESMRLFLEKFNSFEEATKAKDFDMVKKICDVDSLVKYFIVSEFSADPDAYASSLFFYMDGEDDKIHVGPIWDYDFAFSNERWIWGEKGFGSPTKKLPVKEFAFEHSVLDSETNSLRKVEANTNHSRMFFWLEEIPEFRQLVAKKIDEVLYGRRGEYINALLEKARNIRSAAERNNDKWELKNYSDEVEKLIWWIFRRYDYLEKNYKLSDLQNVTDLP